MYLGDDVQNYNIKAKIKTCI